MLRRVSHTLRRTSDKLVRDSDTLRRSSDTLRRLSAIRPRPPISLSPCLLVSLSQLSAIFI